LGQPTARRFWSLAVPVISAATSFDAGERVVVLDSLTTGFDWVAPDASLLIGDTGINRASFN
jgi:hypothetical protein